MPGLFHHQVLTIMRLVLLASCLFMLGCAKGMLWKTGQLSPWARQQLAEEEKIADTLFSKRRRMDERVASARNGSAEMQQLVAEELGGVIAKDSVLLIRLHAVKLLGELNCPAAIDALETASRDNNTDIRVAAIEAWKNKTPDVAISQLQQLVGSDTNVDVRLAATRALGQFKGTPAIRALSLALNDPDPALQLRAADSLRVATGQPFGRDVVAWQEYVQQQIKPGSDGLNQPTLTAENKPLNPTENR